MTPLSRISIYDGDGLRMEDFVHDVEGLPSPGLNGTFQVVSGFFTEDEQDGHGSMKILIEKLIRLTKSTYGSISIKSTSTSSELLCVATGQSHPFPTCVENIGRIDINNLFGYSILNKCIVLSNDVLSDPRAIATMPLGHPKIVNFLSIPVFSGNIARGAISLANKAGGFTSMDVNLIIPIVSSISYLMSNWFSGESVKLTTKQSEINKVKDKFLSTMSHELRTPLNGIVGMVSMLRDAGPLNKKQIKYISTLMDCSYQLMTLMNNILDFSKMASNRLTLKNTQFNIYTDVLDIVSSIASGKAGAKSIDFIVTIEDSVPISMMGDAHRLVQILNNLTDNAIKFTETGTVTLNVMAVQSPDFETTKNLRLIFTVTDTGFGIPIAEQTKIFEAFHQSESLDVYHSQKGTGLGLSICRELVRLMGGDIRMSSTGEPGDGSTFIISVNVQEEINIDTLRTQHSGLFKNTRILIVDDRPTFRLQLTDLVFQWGMEPTTVSSAEEALQYLSRGIKYKCSIIDICMPYMSGVELAQEMTERFPDVPRIALSSLDDNAGADLFDFFLYKPVDQNRIFPAVLSCLQNYAPMGSPIPLKTCTGKSRKPIREIKILVAEDNDTNSYIIHEMLTNLGFLDENIEMVVNGHQCISVAKEKQFDVILMDILMPIMDGIEATTHIRQMKNPPMVVAVSAAVQNSDKERGRLVGIDAYVTKPIIKDKLRSVLQALISSDGDIGGESKSH